MPYSDYSVAAADTGAGFLRTTNEVYFRANKIPLKQHFIFFSVIQDLARPWLAIKCISYLSIGGV